MAGSIGRVTKSPHSAVGSQPADPQGVAAQRAARHPAERRRRGSAGSRPRPGDPPDPRLLARRPRPAAPGRPGPSPATTDEWFIGLAPRPARVGGVWWGPWGNPPSVGL